MIPVNTIKVSYVVLNRLQLTVLQKDKISTLHKMKKLPKYDGG